MRSKLTTKIQKAVSGGGLPRNGRRPSVVLLAALLPGLLALALFLTPPIAPAYADNPAFPGQTVLFLSPHPDDIALTFGGLILNNAGFKGKTVICSTFFSRSQWTDNDQEFNLSTKRINTVTKERFAEELDCLTFMFNDAVNARLEHYGFSDAPVRHYAGKKTVAGGPGGDFSCFKKLETKAFNQIKEIIKSKLQIPDSAIFLLMANGQHIDHFIVREALIASVRELGPDKVKSAIYFGEDQPYTGGSPEEAAREIKQLTSRLNLQPIAYNIDIGKKTDLFTNYYYTQFDDSYVTNLKARYDLLGGKEQIYLWPRQFYSNIPKEASEK